MWHLAFLVAALAVLGTCTARALDFATREELPSIHGARAAVAVALNKDPLPDFVLATDAGIALLLGTQGANLSTPTTIKEPTAPTMLAGGDFDADGTSDIATASLTEMSVRIRYGMGDGSLSDPTVLHLSARPLFLYARDLDGDGRSELLVGTANGISIFRSLRRGHFADPEDVDTQGVEGRWFTALDLNHNGRPDILLLEANGEAVGVFEANTDGGFVPRQASYVGLGPRGAAVADLDNDGKLDLAVALDTGLVWLRGDGKAAFTDPVSLLQGDDIVAVASFDANTDGAPDLAAVDRRRSTLHILLNNGSGKFDRRQSYVVGPMPEGLLVADATGDGVLDVLVPHRLGGGLTLCRGRGDGTFHGLPAFDLGPDPAVALAYDANRDGHTDLAIAHRDSGMITVSFGTGHGGFRLQSSMPTGTDPRALALGDFNSDGSRDLVVANFGSDDIAVLAGDERGGLAAPLFVATGLGPTALAVADFDRDGHDDIAVANSLSNSVSVVISGGRGRFPRTRSAGVSAKPDVRLAGELGGNGGLDLNAGSSRGERV